MPLPTLNNVPRPRAAGFGARINDLLVRLAVGPGEMKIETAPLEPPRINTAETPEDIRDDFGALYSRSGFAGGEGLDFAHRTDQPENASKRYWDSRHINVTPDRPGKLESVELLREGEKIEPATDTNLALAHDGTALYMAEGTMVRRSADPTAGVPTFADDDPHATQPAVTVEDLCTLGEDVYAALNTSGIHKRDGAAGTWSEISTTAAVKVWSAKGVLFASTGTVLSSIVLSTGAATTLVTLPDGEEWLDLTDAGAAILAAASDGYIYALGDNGTGGIELKAQSPVGAGIKPQSLAHARGLVFYATSFDTGTEVIVKWWRSVLTDALVLDDASVIRQFGTEGDLIDRTPKAMASTNDAIWLGVNESDAAHVWRYDLSQAGRARWWDSGATGVVHDILFAEGEPYWTVEAVGLHRQHPDNFAANGYLIGPLGDLFTASAKAWVGALIDTEAVTGGRVELWYTTNPAAILDPDHSAWIRLRRITASSLPDTTETRIANQESRFIAGMIKLYANDAKTISPAARGWTFRAYPGGTEMIVELPVNVSDQIEMPGRRRIRVKGLGERIWQELQGLEGAAVEVELFNPAYLLRGVVEQVSTPVVSQPRRGSPVVVARLRFRGSRIETTEGGSESLGPVGSFSVGSLPAGGSRA